MNVSKKDSRSLAPTLALTAFLIFVGRTEAGDFIPLGDLPGGDFFSSAQDVSDDGRVVVGLSSTGEDAREAFRWTAETGLAVLGDFPGGFHRSSASAVSADGSVIVGSGQGDRVQAFRWTESTGLESLGDLAGGPDESSATDVSDGGAVIVGRGNSSLPVRKHSDGRPPTAAWSSVGAEALPAERRTQMAVFLLRAKHGPGYIPPPPSGEFDDVSVSHWAASWIERLAAEGVRAAR